MFYGDMDGLDERGDKLDGGDRNDVEEGWWNGMTTVVLNCIAPLGAG